ncbi:MAG: hypothetical protein PHF72_10585, partial [Gammaproteobacteria bacterium]|nr:hypothetical protein [Gammaproteobacteria bacterium]
RTSRTPSATAARPCASSSPGSRVELHHEVTKGTKQNERRIHPQITQIFLDEWFSPTATVDLLKVRFPAG